MNQNKFLTIILLVLFWHFEDVEAESRKFKIGLILPLSGAAADYGQSIENSIRLAQEDRPDIFTNIEFIYEDAEHNPTKAVSSFRKLTLIDKVDLVYTWGVPFCKVLAPIAESNKVPLIGQCIDQISSSGRQYVIRFMNYTDEYLAIQTAHLLKQNKKRIGVVLSEHAYLEEMYSALKRNISSEQTVQVIDSYHIGDSDFRTTLSKIRKSNYDVIGVFLYPGQIAQFYRQAREQNLKIATFGTNFFESISEIHLAAGAMDGAEFANNMVQADFIKKYSSRYNNVSQVGFGALAYEFSMLTGRLFNSIAAPLTPQQVIKRYTMVEPQVDSGSGSSGSGLVAGSYEFRNSKLAGQYFYFPIVIKQIKGDNFISVSKD